MYFFTVLLFVTSLIMIVHLTESSSPPQKGDLNLNIGHNLLKRKKEKKVLMTADALNAFLERSSRRKNVLENSSGFIHPLQIGRGSVKPPIQGQMNNYLFMESRIPETKINEIEEEYKPLKKFKTDGTPRDWLNL